MYVCLYVCMSVCMSVCIPLNITYLGGPHVMFPMFLSNCRRLCLFLGQLLLFRSLLQLLHDGSSSSRGHCIVPGDPKLENNEFWAARFGTSLRSCLVLTQLWDHLPTLHEAPSHHPNCAGYLPYLTFSLEIESPIFPICLLYVPPFSWWSPHGQSHGKSHATWPPLAPLGFPWPSKAQHLIDAQNEAHGQGPQDTVQDAGGVHQQQSAFQQDLVIWWSPVKPWISWGFFDPQNGGPTGFFYKVLRWWFDGSSWGFDGGWMVPDRWSMRFYITLCN